MKSNINKKSRCVTIALILISGLPASSLAEAWHDAATGLTWQYCLDGGFTMKGLVPNEYGSLPPGATIKSVSPDPVGALEIPSSLGGHDVVAIDQNFLKQCDTITSVFIPKTVREVSCYAFYDCKNLKRVELSEGLELIAWKAFNRFTGASITLPSTLTVLFTAVLTNADVAQTLTFLGGVPKVVPTHGDDIAFEGRSKLTIYVPRNKGWEAIVSDGTWQGARVLYDGPVIVEGGFESAHSFNGLVRDADGMMCGIVQIVTAKKTAKGTVKANGFAMLEDGKKQTIKAVTASIDGGRLHVTTKAGNLGEMTLTINDDGFTGNLGEMTVASEATNEDTSVLNGSLTMSYFDAKTGKVKTKKVTVRGITSGGEAVGSVTVKGLPPKSFAAEVE